MGGEFDYNTILLRSPLFKRKCVSKASENLFLDFKLFASLSVAPTYLFGRFDFSSKTLYDSKLNAIYHLFVILRRFFNKNILMFNVNFSYLACQILDSQNRLMPVTPIQGPIFIKNNSVPVVPLYAYPKVYNGTFMQIPVSIDSA